MLSFHRQRPGPVSVRHLQLVGRSGQLSMGRYELRQTRQGGLGLVEARLRPAVVEEEDCWHGDDAEPRVEAAERREGELDEISRTNG